MKNLLPIIVFLLIVGGIVYFVTSGNTPEATQSAQTSESEGSAPSSANNGTGDSQLGTTENTEEEAISDEDAPIRPAAEAFKSASEALDAIKKGASEYDDVVLEQFKLPGNDCTFCNEVYASLKDLLASPDTTEDQRGYYSEILSSSGKVENIGTLINLAKTTSSPEQANPYLEALELTVGKDDVVKYLGEQLQSSPDTLRESLVTAITNQGTRTAVDILVKETEASNDPDGYYSKGIGLGEFIPEPEAFPPLQDLVKKRDAKVAPLAVKALLNSGIDGLRVVFDEIGSSSDKSSNDSLLKGAVDHVSYDEDTEKYLREMQAKGSSSQKEFASQILKDFEQAAKEFEQEEAATTPAP